jgi:hypothetical protein
MVNFSNQKIPISDYERHWNGKFWYTAPPFGIFGSYLVYVVVVWYILWSFGIFCGRLVYFPAFG